MYCKSPFNYIGGKYKLLPQIVPLFPDNINRMVDLFAGGCDVCSNVNAKEIYANDINYFVVDIYREFQKLSIEELLEYIDKTIENRHLSLRDEESYKQFRDYYNKTKNPLDLYILMCYSFNYQFRFNSRHEYNNPFGRERSSFNPKMRQNLISFHNNIKNIKFDCMNFKDYNYGLLGDGDFLYADPPYSITVGSYNDGKRGFDGWGKNDDLRLFSILDDLDRQKVKFALSDVAEHKGETNDELISWMNKYNVHEIASSYKNSNYQAKNRDAITREILVTNY